MSDDNQLNISITASSDGVAPAAAQAKAAITALTQSVASQSSVLTSGTQSIKQMTGALTGIGAASSGTAGALAVVEGAAVSAGHGTAGFARELIVLGHEMAMGRYSRFGGSMMVLAERSGQLSNAMKLVSLAATPMGFAIGVAAAAAAAFTVHIIEAAQATGKIQAALDSVGKGYQYNAEQIKAYTEYLSQFAGISRSNAVEALVTLEGAVHGNQEQLQQLVRMMPDIVAMFRGDFPTALKFTATAMNDPAKAAKILYTEFNALTPQQYAIAQGFEETGNRAGETSLVLEALTTRSKGLHEEFEGPLGRGIEAIKSNFSELLQVMNPLASAMLQVQVLSAAIGSGAGTKPLNAPKASVTPAQLELQQQQEINDRKTAALALEKQSGLEVARRAELEGKIAQFTQAQADAEKQGDTASAARFKSDAAELQGELDNLNEKTAKKADRLQDEEADKVRSTQNEILESNRDTGQQILTLKRQEIEDRFKLGQISETQEVALLQQNADQQFAIERKALEDQLALWNQTPAERQKVLNQLTVLEEQHRADILSIQTQAYQDQHKAETKDTSQSISDWKSYANTIGSTLKSAFSSMLQGTLNWKQEMSKLFGDLAGTVFDKLVDKMVTSWFTGDAQKTAATVAGEAARTTATVGGNATRTASDATTATTFAATTQVEAQTDISASAAQAGAAAFASIAAIPIIGPALAPAAGAAAYTSAIAYEGLASFDVGSWNLPGDMVAQVHQGEMIIPRTFADDLRSNGGMGGSSSGDTHVHIHAIDTKSFSDMLRDSPDAIANAFKTAHRNGNRDLRSLAR